MKNDVSKKKTSKEKRVLIAALCIAASVIAGSTFAWFTSQDEVTNRLSAKGAYNTSITETFTPPEDIVPGQEINKDAGAINTGNIDSIVKMTPSATINLTYDKPTDLPTDFTGFVELTAEEAKAMQSGGMLAFTGGTALAAVSDTTSMTVSGKAGTDASATDPLAVYDAALKTVQVSSSAFVPNVTGYYVFKRDFEPESTPHYSGYYAVVTGADVTYYALQTQTETDTTQTTGSQVVSTPYIIEADAAATKAPKLLKTTTVTDKAVTLAYDATTPGSEVIKASYTPDGETTPITFTINLQNIGDGTAADKWQNVGGSNSSAGAFYYTNDLESGTTSTMLVDSVVFDSTNTFAYSTLDFDLDLKLDSVQVVTTNDGIEVLPGATAAGSQQTILGAKATATNSGKEINSIAWAATT
jgi:alternate signal-mediated exported protein